MEEEQPEPTTMEINDTTGTDPAFHELSNYLGVDKHRRTDSSLAKKMAFVYNWSSSRSGGKDSKQILQGLHRDVRKLGVQHKGEELVKYLYQHSRLDTTKPRKKTVKKTVKKPSVKVMKVRKEIKKKIKTHKHVQKKRVQEDLGKQMKTQIEQVKQMTRTRIKKELDSAVNDTIKEALKSARRMYG